MDELLSKATKGVDMAAPDAIWQIFHNLMALALPRRRGAHPPVVS